MVNANPIKNEFIVDLKGFDGPLELLLSLAQKQKVDLTTASMIISMVKQLNKQNQQKVLKMLDNSRTFKDVAKFAFSAGK